MGEGIRSGSTDLGPMLPGHEGSLVSVLRRLADGSRRRALAEALIRACDGDAADAAHALVRAIERRRS